MSFLPDPEIRDAEYLFRGVVAANWDWEMNRPSSAAFKDSKGASVDRDGGRTDEEAIGKLLGNRSFKAILKVSAKDVRGVGAIVLYKPMADNIFHSEIHDSLERPQLRGSKPTKLRDMSLTVYSS